MAESNDHEFWEEDAVVPTKKSKRGRVTIKSILLFMAVMAASAVCIAQFVRGVLSVGEGTAVGEFAIINAMMPTAFLAGAFWFYRLFGRYID